MTTAFFKRLNEPFPSKKNLRRSVVGQFYVALFIAGFLYVFKPFGMANAPMPLFLSIAFGVVSFVFSITFELFCRFGLRIKTDEANWTLWKWLVQMFLMVSWIAFGNHTFQSIMLFGNFGSLNQWLAIWQATLTLGCLPIFVSGLIIQMQAVKSNSQQAGAIELRRGGSNKQNPIIEFALSSSEPLLVMVGDLLYVEAMQNYVLLHIHRNGTVSSHMIRNTIVKTLQQCQAVGADSIIRCHRSFLVNVDLIKTVKGNAQGLKLTLDNTPKVLIPVSRSYMPEFKRASERVIRPSVM